MIMQGRWTEGLRRIFFLPLDFRFQWLFRLQTGRLLSASIETMRRGFSIFLVLFFGLGPLSVFIDSQDANLPACCRRHGAHHCAMAMRMAGMERDTTSGKMPFAEAPSTCRQYPGAFVFFAAPGPALTVAAADLPKLHMQVHIAMAVSAAPDARPACTHAGRGPPLLLV